MKTVKFLVPAMLLMIGFIFSGCDKSDTSNDQTTNTEDIYKTTVQSVEEPLSSTAELGDMDSGELEQSEIEALKYMRMEELLAHDVYTAFFEQYDYPIFNNISNSEAWHAEIVKVMLDKYELDDPEANHVEGVFSDSEFQSLYDSLVAAGEASGTEALTVGATIEDLDIYDLQNHMDEDVDNEDILCAFENLQKGSRNHLRAFTHLLDLGGSNYSPQYISDSLFTEIINSEFEVGPADCGCPMQEEMSETDKESMIYAREAELMAHDLFREFHFTYNYPVFNTMANIEEIHTGILKAKLSFYDIEDPAVDHQPGEFVNQEIQQTYDSLLQQGMEEGMIAVKTGLEIQERSIFNYSGVLEAGIDNDVLECLYINFQRVSRNNLRTLSGVLDNTWEETYTPQFIGQQQYEEIVNSDYEVGPIDCGEDG